MNVLSVHLFKGSREEIGLRVLKCLTKIIHNEERQSQTLDPCLSGLRKVGLALGYYWGEVLYTEEKVMALLVQLHLS